MQIVLIEWDGEKPPTTWYKRLRKLGLKVRGDKSVSPIRRRQTTVTEMSVAYELMDNHIGTYDEAANRINNSSTNKEISAVVVQEGAVVCASPSLARLIAGLAKQHGARSVQVGDIDIGEYSMSEEDHRFLEYVNSVYGRRGHPPADEEDVTYVVTCYEEAESFTLVAKTVVNCPSCHGVRVSGRPGSRTAFRPIKVGDGGDDLLWYWLTTRFSTGFFEIPMVGIGEPGSYSETYDAIYEAKERNAVDLIVNGIDRLVLKTTAENQLRILDAVFANRAYAPAEAIMHARVDGLAVLFTEYTTIDVTKIPLAMPQNSVDLLDAAPIIDGKTLAGYYMANLNGSSTIQSPTRSPLA